jgi:hypothetical protein
MKRALKSVGMTLAVLLVVVVGLYAQTNSAVHGAFNGPIQLPSVFAFVFGDNVSSDITMQKTAANVLTIGGGIPALSYAKATVTTNGTAVAAGTCQAQTAATITGVTTASAVLWAVPTALPASWQTGIDVYPVVTANTVTISLCNGTAGSITPVAQAVNLRVLN